MEILNKINEAVALAKAGKPAAAENIYLELLNNHPNDIRVLPFLGWLYISTGRYHEAIETLEKVNKKTRNLNVITGLGLSYYAINKCAEAYHYLRICVEEKPTLETLEKLITCACENTNQVETIFKYAQKMDELYPTNPKTWDCYILAALCAGKFEEAETYCSDKLAKYPDCPQIYLSAGLIQEVMYSNYELAKECYLKALQITPSGQALYYTALAYSRLKKFDKAEEYLLKALARAPEAPEIHISLYILYAQQKEFAKAYQHFEKSAKNLLATLRNHWQGEKSINSTLYVYTDQGYGDIIMYARYLPYLKEYFKNVVIGLPKALIPLFKESFQEKFFKFIDREDHFSDYDFATILTLIPYRLGIDYEHIPYSEGYLKVNDNGENFAQDSKELKIGLIWEAGGTHLRGPLDRSINIRLLKDLVNIEGAKFYSLQVDPAMDAVSMYPAITDLGSKFNNFLQTAYAAKSMDIIVSVDTSGAHLAAAMGIKTLIMLPYTTDWRWFDDNKTTPWYKSMEVFVQPQPLDWNCVLKSVIARINEIKQERY